MNNSQPKKTRKRSVPPIQLEDLTPKTANQERAFDAYDDGKNLLLIGCAGTGKTLISSYLGLTDVEDRTHERLVIFRSIVPSRDPGFLPGTLREKTAVYELPYVSIFSDLYGRDDAWTTMREKGKVEFMTTSFVRGITIKDSVILIDEVQNMRWSEISSVLTRVGEGCRVIIAGDHRSQSDLQREDERVGVRHLMRVAEEMSTFETIEFTSDDVLRSGFAKDFIQAKERLGLPD